MRIRLQTLVVGWLALAGAASFGPAAAAAAAQGAAAPAIAQRAAEAARLHALFDEAWERTKRDNPEFATYLGDDRYDDRLKDLSSEAIERR